MSWKPRSMSIRTPTPKNSCFCQPAHRGAGFHPSCLGPEGQVTSLTRRRFAAGTTTLHITLTPARNLELLSQTCGLSAGGQAAWRTRHSSSGRRGKRASGQMPGNPRSSHKKKKLFPEPPPLATASGALLEEVGGLAWGLVGQLN